MSGARAEWSWFCDCGVMIGMAGVCQVTIAFLTPECADTPSPCTAGATTVASARESAQRRAVRRGRGISTMLAE